MKLTSENKAKLTVKYNGTNVVISDGTNTFTEVVTSRNFTLSKLMSNGVHDDLDGKLFNFKAWSGGDRNTGTLVCDLVASDNKFVDKTKRHYFTKSVASGGDITFQLSNTGIYDFYATTLNNDFQSPTILDGSFTMGKVSDELVNKIIARYYYNNDTGNSQSSTTYSDSTLSTTFEVEPQLTKLNSETVVGYLKSVWFGANATRAIACVFDSNSTALGLELFDVINVRHPLLRNRFTDMTTKKWLVVGLTLDTAYMITTITVIELL